MPHRIAEKLPEDDVIPGVSCAVKEYGIRDAGILP